jgi:HPt (histidine-containing phosphotransfer) domain-containing protein
MSRRARLAEYRMSLEDKISELENLSRYAQTQEEVDYYLRPAFDMKIELAKIKDEEQKLDAYTLDYMSQLEDKIAELENLSRYAQTQEEVDYYLRPAFDMKIELAELKRDEDLAAQALLDLKDRY